MTLDREDREVRENPSCSTDPYTRTHLIVYITDFKDPACGGRCWITDFTDLTDREGS